jgi:hypothetical protein
MARKNETLINLLTQVPWWVRVVLAAIFYMVLKFIVPAIEFQSFAIKGIINAAPQIAPLVAFVILIPAPVAAFDAWRKRKLLHSQKDLNSVRSPSTVKRPISTGHIQARKPNYTKYGEQKLFLKEQE